MLNWRALLQPPQPNTRQHSMSAGLPSLNAEALAIRSRLAWHKHLIIGTGFGLPFVHIAAAIAMWAEVCNWANDSITDYKGDGDPVKTIRLLRPRKNRASAVAISETDFSGRLRSGQCTVTAFTRHYREPLNTRIADDPPVTPKSLHAVAPKLIGYAEVQEHAPQASCRHSLRRPRSDHCH